MKTNLQPCNPRTTDTHKQVMEMNMGNQKRNVVSLRQTSWKLGTLALTAAAAVTLTGCGVGVSGTSGTGVPTLTGLHISGLVHGGQQPVAGATIQLYTVGTSGLKSASTALIASPTTTTAAGNFTITGSYSCTSATQVYIVATGGNSSGGAGGSNSAIALMAALGSCATLQANAATTFIDINELTTVAANYALAPFAQDYAHIGATGANPTGLVNAFASAASLVNTTSGSAPGTGMPAGAIVPVSELDTLANILAACVNTTSASSSPCATLFSATGATETIGAGFGIAKNPGAAAITALYSLSSATAPFQPAYTARPNDFTVAVSYNANSSLNAPYGIAIDASGDAWITNEGSTNVTELSTTGTQVTTATALNLFGPQGVAIDRSGNVWVANTAGNSVLKFAVTAGTVASSSSYAPSGLAAPTAIALDSNGNAFVTSLNSSSVYGLTNAGATYGSSPYTGNNGNITQPTGVAVGSTGSVYVTTGTGSLVQLSNTGVYAATLNDGTLTGSAGVALDASNNVFVTGNTTGTAVGGAVSEFSASGSSTAVSPVQTNLTNPLGVATDGTSVWVANSATAGSLAQIQAGAAAPVSPAAGFGALNTPIGVAVDASGNVWTTNSGSNSVSKFIGLGAPVVTPLAANVGP